MKIHTRNSVGTDDLFICWKHFSIYLIYGKTAEKYIKQLFEVPGTSKETLEKLIKLRCYYT